MVEPWTIYLSDRDLKRPGRSCQRLLGGLKTRAVFGAITLKNFFLKCFQAFGVVVCVLLDHRALRNLLLRKRKYFRATIEGVWW